MGDRIERFPLFPLGLVLLPGETAPLHIFEERYKSMLNECIDSETEFGVIWISDDGLRDVGCSAEVAQVLERADDGRMNLLVQGTTPFQLIERVDDLEYPAGDVELLDDDLGESEDPEVGAEARRDYSALVERVTENRPDDEEVAALDAYGMAATIAFELKPKQQLLELRDENERLRTLAELCRKALERFDYAEEASDRARTNGKVHHR